jgi:hypothetical protein
VIEEQDNDIALIARAWLKARAQEDGVHGRGPLIDNLLAYTGVGPDPEKVQALRSLPVAAVDQVLEGLVATTPEVAWQVVLEIVRLAPTATTFQGIATTIALLIRAQPELFVARIGAELAADQRWRDAVQIVAVVSNIRHADGPAFSDETRQKLATLAGKSK